MTICSVDLVVNAAIDEFACIANAVIGVRTSGNIDLVSPVSKSNVNPPPVWVPTMSWLGVLDKIAEVTFEPTLNETGGVEAVTG